MRILIAEDSAKMARLLKKGLDRQGYAADVVGSGQDAIWMATENDYDAIVLDVILDARGTAMDGFEVCRRLRRASRWAPVLMVTARDAVADRVHGLDPARHEVVRGGSVVELTPTEFALLEYLMRRPGDVLTRATLVRHVWDFAFDGDPRIVNVYIRSLRGKIDRPFKRASPETVRGLGYRIRDDALGPAAD